MNWDDEILLLDGRMASAAARIAVTQTANLIAYWGLGESGGTAAVDASSTAANGLYSGGYSLGQSGIGDGSLSTYFDGSTARVSLATPLTALNSAFVPNTGSLLAWGKVASKDIWTDGLDHTIFSIGADASNRFYMGKQSVNNAMSLFASFGGVSAGVFPTGQSFTGFTPICITWDKGGNQFKAYIGGVQIGTTQAITGTYAGALSASWTGIGSLTSGSATISWTGNLAHVALWKATLTAAEVANVSIL